MILIGCDEVWMVREGGMDRQVDGFRDEEKGGKMNLGVLGGMYMIYRIALGFLGQI